MAPHLPEESPSPLHDLWSVPDPPKVHPEKLEVAVTQASPLPPVRPKVGAEPLAHPCRTSSGTGACVAKGVPLPYPGLAPALLSVPIPSVPGPLDFEAYSAAALQEGKYVWTWMPRLDCGEREAELDGKGAPPALSCSHHSPQQ